MKNTRKGLGKGLGTGYKNLAPMDSHIHSLSAKGCKTRQLNTINFNKEITHSEKGETDITIIGKEIKDQLKKDFPNSKFSIRVQRYSGGQSLTIDLVETDIKVIKDFKDIPEEAFDRIQSRDGWRTLEQVKEMYKNVQSSGFHQLHFSANQEYNPKERINGVFLTKEGFDMLKKTNDYAQHFNWDNSDVMIDYFDVNYYVHLNLGNAKSDKPLTQQGKELKGEY